MKLTKLLDKRLLVVLLLLFSGVALLLNIRSRQETRRNAAAPARTATMTLDAGSTNLTGLTTNQTFVVDVKVLSAQQAFYGADVIMEFNKDVLEVVSIARGANVGNGCVTGTDTNKAVLAPVVSDTDVDCNFKDTETGGVVPTANTSGRLEFGVVAFDWHNTAATYQPAPFPAAASTSVAQVTFRAKANGSSTINLVKAANDCTPAPQCGTTDSNVAALGTGTPVEVGDILNTVNAALNVTVGGTGITPPPATPTTGGSCSLHGQGDANCDGVVDISDISEVVTKMQGGASTFNTDVSGDGVTDISDISIIVTKMQSP